MSAEVQPRSLFDGKIVAGAAVDALKKLNPRALMKNPVIFVTEVVSALVTLLFLLDLAAHDGQAAFSGQIYLRLIPANQWMLRTMFAGYEARA